MIFCSFYCTVRRILNKLSFVYLRSIVANNDHNHKNRNSAAETKVYSGFYSVRFFGAKPPVFRSFLTLLTS